MAILPHFPGLRVEILVDKKALDEYSHPNDIFSGSVSTKWIEARTDEAFKLRVTYSEPFTTDYAVSLQIFCDGAQIARTVKPGKELYKASGHTYSGVPVKRGGESLIQRFYFEALDTVESESMLNTQLTETVENIGTITVAFQFAKGVRKVATKTSGVKRLHTPTRVPEKAMKGDEKSHAIGLGPVEEALSPTKFMKWKDVGTPFARFHFRYRSREVLHAMGILDRQSTIAADLSGKDILQPSPDTLDNSNLLDELLEGDQHAKRKAVDTPVKEEADVAPRRTSGRYWLKDEEVDQGEGVVRQRLDVVPRNTTYGKLLNEADDEEREALAAGRKYPGKKQRR